MKVYKIIPFVMVLSVLAFTDSLAQVDGIDKGELLSAMNSFDDIDLGSDKEVKLKEANEKAIDRVFDIANSDDSDENKLIKFKNAREENSKLFKGILDEKEFKKYKKSVKKKIKPFKRKAKLVGFLL